MHLKGSRVLPKYCALDADTPNLTYDVTDRPGLGVYGFVVKFCTEHDIIEVHLSRFPYGKCRISPVTTVHAILHCKNVQVETGQQHRVIMGIMCSNHLTICTQAEGWTYHSQADIGRPVSSSIQEKHKEHTCMKNTFGSVKRDVLFCRNNTKRYATQEFKSNTRARTQAGIEQYKRRVRPSVRVKLPSPLCSQCDVINSCLQRTLGIFMQCLPANTTKSQRAAEPHVRVQHKSRHTLVEAREIKLLALHTSVRTILDRALNSLYRHRKFHRTQEYLPK